MALYTKTCGCSLVVRGISMLFFLKILLLSLSVHKRSLLLSLLPKQMLQMRCYYAAMSPTQKSSISPTPPLYALFIPSRNSIKAI